MSQVEELVLILFPRLDVTFKEGPTPVERSPLPPIRKHWQRFISALSSAHVRAGHKVIEIERPLWQLTPDSVRDIVSFFSKQGSITRVYIPHRDAKDFPLPGLPVHYYMQTVFPECFTIDPQGWGASMSIMPIEPVGDERDPIIDRLRARLDTNQSKFDQPPQRGPFALGRPVFLCQIPHDETIRKHAAISVADALRATLAIPGLPPLIVKGHPVNPGSMIELHAITEWHPHATWVDDRSLHDVLVCASAVFTVNSGSGIEAILHNKPVFVYGSAEYDSIAYRVTPETVADVYHRRSSTVDRVTYDRWLSAYYRSLFDTTDPETFNKIFPAKV